MEKANEIASKLLDGWDCKHWGRCPIANGSFQYKTGLSLTDVIAQALREAEAQGMERAAKIAKGTDAEQWIRDAAKDDKV